MHDTLITKDGFEKLQAELEELRTTGRAAIVQRIRAAAAAESNAAESVEYQDARDEQALLERRIAVLEERLAASVVDEGRSNGAVDVSERVTVRNVDTDEVHEYQLVGTLEAAPSEGHISVASPVGRALLGRRVGETAVVAAPRGPVRLKVVAIREERRARLAGTRAPGA